MLILHKIIFVNKKFVKKKAPACPPELFPAVLLSPHLRHDTRFTRFFSVLSRLLHFQSVNIRNRPAAVLLRQRINDRSLAKAEPNRITIGFRINRNVRTAGNRLDFGNLKRDMPRPRRFFGLSEHKTGNILLVAPFKFRSHCALDYLLYRAKDFIFRPAPGSQVFRRIRMYRVADLPLLRNRCRRLQCRLLNAAHQIQGAPRRPENRQKYPDNQHFFPHLFLS